MTDERNRQSLPSTRTVALLEAAEARLRDALENFEVWSDEAMEDGLDVLPAFDRMRALSDEVLNG